MGSGVSQTGSITAMTPEEEEHLAHERVTAVPISQPLPQPVTLLPLPHLGLAAPSQVSAP
jgi:hypothetical protein